MKQSLQLLIALAGPAVINAHTIFTTLLINDKTQGDGTCVRMNMDAQHCTDPIGSLSSDDMACGPSGEKAVNFTCPAPAGSKLTFEWRLWADLEQPGVLDPSHKGPCAVYAKQIGDMKTSSAAGPGWFKLWDEGYDVATGKWCTEKIIDNKGLMSIDIPPGLPAGNWLFRPELLALHNADQGDPQFYTGCAQVFVQSEKTGTLNVPSEYSVSIPGYVKAGDPSVSFNIYTPKFPYHMPGPKVYNVPSSNTRKSKREALVQTEGVIPNNCLSKNANWCGTEVADYATQDGCWASANQCWAQAKTCYNSAPPTGDANCKAWEKKCQGINDACDAGNYSGPPNKGVKLEDAEASQPADIPASLNTGAESDGTDSGSYNSGSSDAKETGGYSSGDSTTAFSSATDSDDYLSSATPTAAYGNASATDSDESMPSATSTATPENTSYDQDEEAMDVSSTSSAAATTPTSDSLKVSPDGTCGGSTGYTCKGSTFGTCCSKGKCTGRKSKRGQLKKNKKGKRCQKN